MNTIITIPEIEKWPYLRQPNNTACPIIDTTRLCVDTILSGGVMSAENINFEGKDALVLSYEEGGKKYPVSVMGIDIDEKNRSARVYHIQGVKNRKYSYRVNASFDVYGYFLAILTETFLKKWIPVTAEKFPMNIEDSKQVQQAFYSYEAFCRALEGRKEKYCGESISADKI